MLRAFIRYFTFCKRSLFPKLAFRMLEIYKILGISEFILPATDKSAASAAKNLFSSYSMYAYHVYFAWQKISPDLLFAPVFFNFRKYFKFSEAPTA